MPVSSLPPIPSRSSGNGGFIGAGVVMLALTGGLIFWKMGQSPEAEANTIAAPTPTPQPEKPVFEQAPPPPPPEEEAEEPTPEADQTPKKAALTRRVGNSACPAECVGTPAGTFNSTLRSIQGLSRGSYQRALRQNASLQGSLRVSIKVGTHGRACGASVLQDSVGGGVGACISQKFRSATYPAPKGGCVNAVVPIKFEPKQ